VINDTVLQLVSGQLREASRVAVHVTPTAYVREIVVDYQTETRLATVVVNLTTQYHARPQIVNAAGSSGVAAAARWTDGRTTVIVRLVGDRPDAFVQVDLKDIAVSRGGRTITAH
jgi:hypothetical protein